MVHAPRRLRFRAAQRSVGPSPGSPLVDPLARVHLEWNRVRFDVPGDHLRALAPAVGRVAAGARALGDPAIDDSFRALVDRLLFIGRGTVPATRDQAFEIDALLHHATRRIRAAAAADDYAPMAPAAPSPRAPAKDEPLGIHLLASA